MIKENWLPVVGFEDRYEVSDFGGVRSVMNNRGRAKAPTLLSLQKHAKTGYWQVNFKRDGKVLRPYVAHLVLEAFVGPRPDGLVACHGDGNKDNNAKSNLRWDTHAANIADKKSHGTDGAGERNSMAKITSAKADEIRSRFGSGQSCAEISRNMNLSYWVVYSVATGRRWTERSAA